MERGDEEAINQLKVLHKVAHPYNYELPSTVIKNLADSYHTSPHLARAWSVRDIMIELSYMVEPTRKDRSVLEGPVKLCGDPLLFPPSTRYQRAARLIKKNTTLQSLAIAVFIEELDEEGIHLDPRQLKHDLQKLKEWESANLTDSSYRIPLGNNADYPSAWLPPIHIYSEGWKRLWRRGDKK